MNEILIIQDNTQYPIDGRELHEKLAIDTPYRKWFPRMCEYGFIENIDFSTEDRNVRRVDGAIMPQMEQHHYLTLSMAKEICMLQRSEAGRNVRRYLIDLEAAWNTPEQVMARALRMADKTIAQLKGSVGKLEGEVAKRDQVIGELKPKADYTDIILSSKRTVTITQIAKDYGMSGNAMNKLLESSGVQYKQNGQWLLYAKHHGKGYTHSKTSPLMKNGKCVGTQMHTQWTQKGRLFIYELLKEKCGVLPVIEKEVAA